MTRSRTLFALSIAGLSWSLAGCGGGTAPGDSGVSSDGLTPGLDAPGRDAPGADARGPDAPEGADARSVPRDSPAAPDAPVSRPDAGPPPMSRDVRCGDPAPEGAARAPAPRAYSGGTCPMLAPGMNTITSGGNTRRFLLVTPSDLRPDEHLPVLFMWHWLKGSPDDFLMRGNVQAAADTLRVIAVIPESKGDVIIDAIFTEIDMVWPYLTSSSTARMEEEFTFFDDMLSCVDAQYAPDRDCVSSVGVSAGALWTSQLLQHRSENLASAIVLSGGVGPASGTSLLDVEGWRRRAPDRPIPTLVLWGGPTDTCAINFERASRNLEAELDAQGSFVLECIHDCGHDVPPVDDMSLGVAALYQFALDHPYWLLPLESPYHVRGLPSGLPTWCAIGSRAAIPRRGMCDPDGPACDFPSL